MHEDLSRDPWRDPELAAALRASAPEPPLDAVEWDALRRRVGAAARLALALRRRTWTAYLAGWARPAVPALVAASAALAVVLFGPIAIGGVDEHAAAAPAALEDVLTAGAAADPLGGIALADGPDALLEAALRWED